MAWYSRLLSMYYILHTLLPLTYLVFRPFFPTSSAFRQTEYFGWILVTREMETIVLGCIIGVLQVRRATSFESGLESALLVAKAAMAYLFSLASWNALVRFMIAWALLTILVSRPPPQASSKVKVLQAGTFRTRIAYAEEYDDEDGGGEGGGGEKKDDDVVWVVMFGASWNSKCVNFIPAFHTLASRYGTEKVKFARVDISLWPEVAKWLDLDTSITSPNLPSFSLFEKGLETRRIPPKTNTRPVMMDTQSIIRAFHLDRRRLET